MLKRLIFFRNPASLQILPKKIHRIKSTLAIVSPKWSLFKHQITDRFGAEIWSILRGPDGSCRILGYPRNNGWNVLQVVDGVGTFPGCTENRWAVAEHCWGVWFFPPFGRESHPNLEIGCQILTCHIAIRSFLFMLLCYCYQICVNDIPEIQ